MISCFVLKDKIKNLYLTPFLKDKMIGSKDSEEKVVWYSSEKLNEEDRDNARLFAYKEIDESINLWIQEKRYFPRLLISAFTFLVVYFFMSLVIRDPIPMLDEMVGSFLGAILMWMFISKRDKQSDIVNKKKLEIKREVSNADFQINKNLSALEFYLDDLRSYDLIDLSDKLLFVDEETLKPLTLEDSSFLPFFNDYLSKQIFVKNSLMKDYFNKVIESRKEKIKNESLSSKLVQLSREAQIDVPLLALMIMIEEYEEPVRGLIK